MAENLVKSLKEKPPKIRKKNRFEELPDAKIKERAPRIFKRKESVIRDRFLGNPQMGIKPDKKASKIKDGRKIK